MNVTLEKNSDLVGKIIVNVTESDYADKVTKQLKEIQKKRSIPGFRQGHTPIAQIKKLFGKAVKSDVLNNEVYNGVIDYLRENKVEVLGEPLPVTVEEVDMAKTDFTFEYEIGLAPEIKITIDKTVTLPYRKIEVSEQMLKEEDENLCQRMSTRGPGETVEGRAIVKGSIQQLNEDGSVNEKDGAVQVVDGIVAPFLFKSEDEKAKFIGKKVNDKVVFNPYNSCEGNAAEMAAMLHLDKEIAKDVKSDFVMAISEIIVATPAEHNQDFYDNVFGKDKVKTEDEYKTALTQMISAQLNSNSVSLFNHDAEEYLLNTYGEMQLPDTFLKRWLVARNEELTEENIDKEYDNMVPSIKWQMIKERVAKILDVKVTEDDVLNYAKGIAYRQFAQYGMTNMDDATLSSAAKHILEDKNMRPQIVEEVSSDKLFTAMRNAVTLDEKTVSFDDFKKIVSDINAKNVEKNNE